MTSSQRVQTAFGGWPLWAVAAVMLLTGCASGSFSPEQSCSSDDDCDDGAQCVAEICQFPDTGMPSGRDTDGNGGGGEDTGGTTDPATDTGSDDDPQDTSSDNDGGGGDDDTGQSTDTAPPDCNDQCGLGEECQNGSCVSKCQPSCNADQECLDIGEGPQCYANCPEAQSAEGCLGSGKLCRDLHPDENEELLVCIPSQCDTDADCQAGSCLHYINDFGACVSTGPNAVGESCDRSDRNELCERGSICIPDGTGTSGTCRELCDPWNPRCDSGGYCSLLFENSQGLSFLTRRQGYCNPQTDPDGNQPFQRCQSPGNMCSDAVRCVGSADPACIKWCRPGEGDCNGTVPSQYSTDGVCHNYTFPGIREVGRCVPRCNSSTVTCPDGFECKSGLCRQRCTAGTVVQDCCSGNTPCHFECSNGFCE